MSLYYCQNRRGPSPTVFVIQCKRCSRHVPAGVVEYPRDNLRVDCPLCGEKRRYRPAEVYLGWPDGLLKRQNR